MNEKNKVDTNTFESRSALDDRGSLKSIIYKLSHDLGAPVRLIDGFSKALYEDLPQDTDPLVLEDLGQIRNAVESMSKMIEGLLRFSRGLSTELSIVEVDLAAVVQEVAAAFQRSDEKREVEFLCVDSAIVQADPLQIKVALECLIGNAWKFTSKSAKASIEFGSFEEDGKTVYFVKDNGVGIGPEAKGKLFMPFERFHSVSEFAGAGIGLATARQIISRHGGKIWARSRVNEGTELFFTL